MEKLVRGVHHFESTIFRERHELFERLVGGQHPQALFITCSDSRVEPSLITQADPGDLFVLRNAGNIVPSHAGNDATGAEAATIEYAIRGLGIKDIVICGHTRCGAMQALLKPESLDTMPRVRKWLRNSDATKEIVQSLYPNLTDEAQWKIAIEENVLVQIENLRTHPAVAVALARGELKLHAWVYKMETGQIFTYDPDHGQYEPLQKANGQPLASVIATRKPLPNEPLASL